MTSELYYVIVPNSKRNSALNFFSADDIVWEGPYKQTAFIDSLIDHIDKIIEMEAHFGLCIHHWIQLVVNVFLVKHKVETIDLEIQN